MKEEVIMPEIMKNPHCKNCGQEMDRLQIFQARRKIHESFVCVECDKVALNIGESGGKLICTRRDRCADQEHETSLQCVRPAAR